MAAPGIGIGDIILACQTIYEYGKRYKDAPKEFEEIADKAGSLTGTLERIRKECLENGNIVLRMGSASQIELQNLLLPLKKDATTLKEMVLKYADIRQEGYARRMMFAFKESGDLADLRRKIGLHEQALQMWYMTVIVSSLRRIEGGVDELKKLQTFKAMERMGDAKLERMLEKVLRNARKRNESTMYSRPEVMMHSASIAGATVGGLGIRPPKKTRLSRMDTYTAASPPDEVTVADVKPLKDELLKTGLPEAEVEATMADAVEYLFASRRERQEMEEQAETEVSKKRPSATSYETAIPSKYGHQSYGSYATRPGQSRYDDIRFETRPHISRNRSEQRERSPEMAEIRRSRSQKEAPKVRIFTDDEYAPPRNAGKERPRANSDYGSDIQASSKKYLTIERTPHFQDLEMPQSYVRRRASDASRNGDRNRPRSDFLVVPEASNRRNSAPSGAYYEDEVEFVREAIREVDRPSRPRITRSQSPRPGVTQYTVRSDGR